MLLHGSEMCFFILHRTVSPWKTNLIHILFYLGCVLSALWIHWGMGHVNLLLFPSPSLFNACLFKRFRYQQWTAGRFALHLAWWCGREGLVPLHRGGSCREQVCFHPCMTVPLAGTKEPWLSRHWAGRAAAHPVEKGRGLGFAENKAFSTWQQGEVFWLRTRAPHVLPSFPFLPPLPLASVVCAGCPSLAYCLQGFSWFFHIVWIFFWFLHPFWRKVWYLLLLLDGDSVQPPLQATFNWYWGLQHLRRNRESTGKFNIFISMQ